MSDFSISEEGGINQEIAEEEARALGARIVAGDAPAAELRRILYASNSREYGRAIATRAANVVIDLALSDSTNIIVAGVIASRLSQFIKDARSQMARFEPTGT